MRRRLAPELVGGVVQVGEVLDLRDRQQPGQPRTEREPEDGLLVQHGVEHPARAEPGQQPPGHPVDPALAGDVLAEHQHLRACRQRVGERGVDRLGQGQRPRVLRQPGAERRLPAFRSPGGRRGAGRHRVPGSGAPAAPSPAPRWPAGASRPAAPPGPGCARGTPRTGPAPRPGTARPPRPAAGRCRSAGRRPGPRRPRRARGRRTPRPSPRARQAGPTDKCRNAGERRCLTHSAAASAVS